jgi:hypothetical protein
VEQSVTSTDHEYFGPDQITVVDPGADISSDPLDSRVLAGLGADAENDSSNERRSHDPGLLHRSSGLWLPQWRGPPRKLSIHLIGLTGLRFSCGIQIPS